MQVNWVLGLEVGVVAMFAAVGGLLALSAIQARTAGRRGAIYADPQDGTSFLFDGAALIDATPDARALLSLSPVRAAPWQRLTAYLAPQFPDFEARIAQLAGVGRLALASADDAPQPLLLEAELRGGLTRITLLDPEEQSRAAGPDALSLRAAQTELDQLRDTIGRAPLLVWREDAQGGVTWANAAYLTAATRRLEPGQDLMWPLPHLFEPTATAQGASGQRQMLTLPGEPAHWFDLVSFSDGDGRLLFGLPVDAAVQAEGALHDFMQTLTKTFAHLPIGLAIFDRQRQLALFNPALLDLTGLQPDFLALRPTLFAFLDAMRDGNMIPEPKDYRSWRKQMSELEKSATSGLYEETWSLPSGQTYRVIGRPHPNGALALMFEDISTEMSRTRRYRADLELDQAVVDALDEAVAVFSQSGLLVMSNAAYAALWGHDPAATLGDGSIISLCAHWRDHSAPSPVWDQVAAFVANLDDRKPWRSGERLTDGRLVECRFAPLPGGATLITFRVATQANERTPKLASTKRRKSA